MKERKNYQRPDIHIVEAVEAVAMLNANSGKATIGDLNDGGNLGDNTSGNASIGELNWSSDNELGTGVSGNAKMNSFWDEEE